MVRIRILVVMAIVMSVIAVPATASADGGPLHRPSTWVDGELFAGVVTPATFDPANGRFDELYNAAVVGCSFKDDTPLISESGPGDQDYNGGRWHLNVLKGSVGCDKYDDADTVEVLDPEDFTPMDVYFECPLRPRRGRNA